MSDDVRPRTGAIEDRALDKLEALPERLGRRSFVGRLSRVLLAAAGATFVSTVAPIDRRPAEATHDSDCTYWNLCGLCGTKCTSCQHDESWLCPPGSWEGSYWTWCCDNGIRIYRIRYKDCCGKPTCGQFCDNNCHNVTTAWCYGYAYHCTLISTFDSCT